MSLFYPDIIKNSIFDIDINNLVERGIKAIVFDIDNTLAYNNEKEPSEKVCEFIKEIKNKGFYVIVASNNSEERVRKFCEKLDSLYVYRANKPLGKKINLLLKSIKVKRKEACLIGDQIFTDVLCANLMGMLSLLVKPFDTNENDFIKFKRKVENLIIKW